MSEPKPEYDGRGAGATVWAESSCITPAGGDEARQSAVASAVGGVLGQVQHGDCIVVTCLVRKLDDNTWQTTARAEVQRGQRFYRCPICGWLESVEDNPQDAAYHDL